MAQQDETYQNQGKPTFRRKNQPQQRTVKKQIRKPQDNDYGKANAPNIARAL
jgi:hypothetical protein